MKKIIIKKENSLILSSRIYDIILKLLEETDIDINSNGIAVFVRVILNESNPDKFFEFIDNNLLIVDDIINGTIDINKLSNEEKNTFLFLRLILENFGKINIDNINNISFNGPLKEQGYILIEKNYKIIGISKYEDIIKEVVGEEPFFLTKLYKIEEYENNILITK